MMEKMRNVVSALELLIALAMIGIMAFMTIPANSWVF